MRTTTWLGYGLLTVALAAACWRLSSQPFAPTPGTRPAIARPTQTGRYLLREATDFRKNLFDEETIIARVRRGVVCLLGPNFQLDGSLEEHSTSEWNTVSAALRSMGKLERLDWRPQVRVVQRDAILQSVNLLSPAVLLPTFSGSTTAAATGFEPSFLERQLQAGDVIIIAARRD